MKAIHPVGQLKVDARASASSGRRGQHVHDRIRKPPLVERRPDGAMDLPHVIHRAHPP
jgi:hypothetical protein